MTWVSDYNYTWLQKLGLNVIRSSSSIPRHIAFVMDGNRRFAKSEHIPHIDGHARGFEKLADCLRWCLDIGVTEVTTFAFSIENFKRSEEEVNGLFALAREKFDRVIKEKEKLKEHGVCIRVIGNISLLPKDIQELIAKCILETEQNNKLYLNVAFSYSARDEMTQAVETILKYGDELNESDITERLMEECLYTRHSPAPDLLIRTSGEHRISDFLMWQLSTTVLYFTKVLWPQLTFWDFLAGIFFYQRANYNLISLKRREQRKRLDLAKQSSFYSERVQKFLYKIDQLRKDIYLNITSIS